MTKRSAAWNAGLAQDLQNKTFAREFILASAAEGLSLQAVLAKLVRAYGVTEFAAKVKLPPSNLLRAINPKHNPTINTLNQLLKPFGLCVGVTAITKTKPRAA